VVDAKTINAGVLAMSYLDDGPPEGCPVMLSHGFPFDVHAYDEVVPLLTIQGARVIRLDGASEILRPGGTADQTACSPAATNTA
jgi:hypothetical protein